MTTQYWLVKQEPDTYAWEQFARDRRTTWDGVRNFQARNFLRAMRVGDQALFYASNGPRSVLGVARVTRAAFPDPTATEGDWSAVELTAEHALPRPVTLTEIKADPACATLPLLRQSRLSVMPVEPAVFARILTLAKTPA